MLVFNFYFKKKIININDLRLPILFKCKVNKIVNTFKFFNIIVIKLNNKTYAPSFLLGYIVSLLCYSLQWKKSLFFQNK